MYGVEDAPPIKYCIKRDPCVASIERLLFGACQDSADIIPRLPSDHLRVHLTPGENSTLEYRYSP